MRTQRDEVKPSDRRRSPRRRLSTRVAVKTEKAIFFMESLDLSETGIRVTSEVELEAGTRVQLVPFFDDVARLFETSGTVVRTSETITERPGRLTETTASDMGIEFDTLGRPEMEALLAILRQADAPAAPAILRA